MACVMLCLLYRSLTRPARHKANSNSMKNLIPLAVLGCTLGLQSALAINATVATPDDTINTDGWALQSPNMSGYNAALTDPAFFGPAGTVDTTVTVNYLNSVNAASLAGVDVFIAPWWNDAQAAGSVADVVNFFLAGGNLFLLQDDPLHDAIGAALGIATFNSSSNPHDILDPNLNNGSFGTVNQAIQSFTQGYLQAADITSNGGTVGATDANGQATIGVWDYGDYAAGAGRMLIFADVDLISTAGVADYVGLNDNAVLALNATEYLLKRPQARVPDSGSSAVLVLFGLAGLVYLKRFKAISRKA